MTLNKTYQKSIFLQKILGRNYKWWYLIQYNFKLAFNDRFGIFVTVLRFTIPLLITLLIYSSFESSRNLGGELALTNYFFQITAIAFGISWDLRFNIIKGGLSNKLLVPTDYIKSQLFVALGFSSFTLFLRTLVYIPILLFLGTSIIFSFNLLLAFCLMFLSFLTFLSLEIIIGSSAFWFSVASNRILEIYYDLIPVFSGAIIILSLNPITQRFIPLPFAIAAYHPMQIYLGKYSVLETFYIFLGGVFWCTLFYFLARFVFKMGLKRNEAVGL